MPNCCLTLGPGIFGPEILCRPSSAAQIQLHYHHSDPLVLIRMESTYKPVSAHTYKAMEAEIRSILLPTGTDPLAITAKDIRNAIYRILQNNKSPMTQSTLSRLKEMIKQRRTIFNQFCEGDSLCHGHLYWIELWETAPWDSYSFCCKCSKRMHTECKVKWFASKGVRDNACAWCRGNDDVGGIVGESGSTDFEKVVNTIRGVIRQKGKKEDSKREKGRRTPDRT